MGETDPFVWLVCLSGRRRPHGRALLVVVAPPGPAAGPPWGVSPGDRVGTALSYLTPARPWHTIWRTLANGGE
ncbi:MULTISPECIES: hypothetical protein [unclassified Streptomyces]|uniref:hypothetical protein n=1 Tax=unclassified Streptomyces TaxID=2593676 RepID=UPI0022371C05|nr:hypothetical protein [Streptomyces sp. SHP 1-2]MCW5252070.1 hypothetical protein [Streptomyces sp. SHP 1-2]